MTHSPEKKNFILSDYLRVRFKKLLDSLASFLNGLGLMPNTVTMLGLVASLGGAVLVATGHFLIGGLLVLVGGGLDGLDGTMARLRKLPVEYGGFVDSVSDRYAEAFLFGGLLIYAMSQDDWPLALGIYLAISGSVLVSYIRARGAAAGMDTKVGIGSRFERYVFLVLSLLFGYPQVGVWLIAAIANITALQRVIDVRRQAKEKNLIRNQ